MSTQYHQSNETLYKAIDQCEREETYLMNKVFPTIKGTRATLKSKRNQIQVWINVMHEGWVKQPEALDG